MGSRDFSERELFERAVRELEGRRPASLVREKEADVALASGPRTAVRPGGRRRQLARPPVLDLHGLDRATAEEKARQFVQRHRRQNSVLIVHGKGGGVLAAHIRRWLDRSGDVVRHDEAPARWGGAGARVVYFR